MVSTRIEGYSRYEVFPDGKVLDSKTGRHVILNRHLNFCMYPDGSEVYTIHNLRTVIKKLVRDEIPGFEQELEPYRPPDFFTPLTSRKEGTHIPKHEVKAKEIHDLRRVLSKASDDVLRCDDSEIPKFKERFLAAKANLEDFKDKNPFYHKWPPYAEIKRELPEVVKELRQEEASLLAELSDVNDRIKEVKKKLFGVLTVLGYY